jgi:hypothetical protein
MSDEQHDDNAEILDRLNFDLDTGDFVDQDQLARLLLKQLYSGDWGADQTRTVRKRLAADWQVMIGDKPFGHGEGQPWRGEPCTLLVVVNGHGDVLFTFTPADFLTLDELQ